MALPGIAAVLAATARYRAWRTCERAARRTPPELRLGFVLLLALVAACHSIDLDQFAHGPVPLPKLPFIEPVAFSGGAVVEEQQGLLGSYFAGAAYERLDHQQVDPNVDFVWDATGNPVIAAPDGIDHNDGDFRLPDSWGIWSVVWEGYLAAPTDGVYALRLHVNNGGWLEMNAASGGLQTIVNCPGGTSFEGDCDGSATLTKGRGYLRVSYYNNAPPVAVARLLWQPPGAADFAVIPSTALFTQRQAANAPPFVSADGDAVLFAGDVLTRTGSFADPDAGETWSATVDYGDGAGPSALSLAADKTFTLSHRYSRPGTFGVVVGVDDSRGGTGSASFTVTVKRRPLVFVPGMFASELGVDASGIARGIPNGHGGTIDMDYPGCGVPLTNPAVWLNFCEAAKPGADDFFDLLKYDPATGTALVPAIHPTGNMVKSPTPFIRQTLSGYEEVEDFFTRSEHDGYVLGDDFAIFTYDWRAHVDAAATVTQLSDKIAALRARTGAPRVDIVANSQGGLLMKAFLLYGAEREHVDQVVLLGSPLIGTPLLTFGLLGGTCLPVFQEGLTCLIDPQEVADVSRTLPMTLDLAPSPAFYDLVQRLELASPYIDYRLESLFLSPRDDYAAFLRRARAAGIPEHYILESQQIHSDDLLAPPDPRDKLGPRTAPWLTRVPPNVHLSLVAGSGFKTVGQVIERTSFAFDITAPGSVFIRLGTTTEVKYVDGDFYVVMQSASLNLLTSLPDNVRRCFAPLDHVRLTLNEGLPIALAILRGQDPTKLSLCSDAPLSQQPTGTLLLDSHSPVDLLVTSALGQRTGFDGASAFGEIPGATLNRIGEAEFLTLPLGLPYAARLVGLASGESLLRLRTAGTGTDAQFVYAHVPVAPHSVATLSIDASGRPAALLVDLDGDGRVDHTIAPVELSGAAADDLTPPVVRITSPDGPPTVGTVQVGWDATDALSGVARSFAVLDRTASGGTLLSAPGPVQIGPGTHTLEVFAEDRAGIVGSSSVRFVTYALEWLVPLTANGRYEDQAGRTIPVRFVVRRADGTLVGDRSVTLSLLNSTGRVVAGPLVFGKTPADGVVFRDASGYQGNLSTQGVAAGSYVLRARFDSPSLVGDLLLGIDLR